MKSRNPVPLKNIFFAFVSFFTFLNSSKAQLVVTPSQPATVLANTLAGPGVTTFGATLTCPALANGIFTVTGTLLSMSSGVVLTNGHASACSGTEPALTSTNLGTAGDPTFVTSGLLPAGTATFDACILEFNVVATSDTLSFNYQFGSEEYRTAVCSHYNDAFGFFISGPGIVGTPNIALVPGTNIPVEVNSVNNGVPGASGGVLSNCTMLGAGSPFTSLYLDNTGGTQLSYRGFTKKFRAFHTVTPCDTYHLKLAVVDAGNATYDSGVFLEAGSLDINKYAFNHIDSLGATVNGIPHTIVKGCSPTTVKIVASHANTIPVSLNLIFGGTAVNGVDVTTIPTSIVLPADSTSVSFNVSGIPTPPGGTSTLTIYLQSTCGIADSIKINIMDTPSASILTPDTSICIGASVLIRTSGTTGLTYGWTPTTGLSSSTVMQPTATPTSTTTYVMTATLPNSGCPAISKSVTINVVNTAITMVTHDTAVCGGGFVDIILNGSASNTYSWLPTTGLSSASIQDPVATPIITTTYTVTATGAGGICPSTAQLTITVGSVAANILTPDTTICLGASFQIRAVSTPGLTYSWSPTAGLSSPSVLQPNASPTTTTSYTLTATGAGSGCPPVVKVLNVTVVNTAISMITTDTAICNGMFVNVLVNGAATNNYSWYPATGLSNPSIQDPSATPIATTTYTVTATGPGGACPSTAQWTVTVNSIFANILTPDTTECGATFTIRVNATPGLSFLWGPATGLNNPVLMDPIASPSVTTTYTMTATSSGSGCPPVVKTITVTIASSDISMITPDTTICLGDSVHLRVAGSNTFNYSWLPITGLGNTNINDPTATPSITTTYTVTAINPESSCPSFAHVKITVIIPRANILTPDTTICRGTSLQVLVDTTQPSTYHWSPPIGLSNPNIADPIVVLPTQLVTYTLTVTTIQNSCIANDVLHVNVSGSGTVKITNTDSSICLGTGVTFLADGDISNSGVIWNFGDGSTLQNVNPALHAFHAPGIYTVSVTALFHGCPDTVQGKTVYIFANPQLDLGPDTAICPGGDPILLHDNINIGISGAKWLWNNGETTPAISVGTSGLYFAIVTFNGCSTTDSVWVAKDCYLDIPNAFTPNGDGVNDYFFPRQYLTKGLTNFKMDIYNRWGQLIFSTETIDGRGWDGNFNSTPQSEGVYIYVMDAQFKDGQKEHHQGNITLLR